MPINCLKQFLFQRNLKPKKGEAKSAPAVSDPALQRRDNPHAPVYPPIDAGIEGVSISRLLEQQADLIRRIQLVASLPDDEFELLYMKVIREYAAYVHLLPASEAEHHRGQGGLLRLGLELSFYCLQASEQRIFSGRTGIEERVVLEPRWRYAAFLAGLYSEVWVAVTNLKAITPAGEVWPPFECGLLRWMNQKGAKEYHVRWRHTPNSGHHSSERGNTPILVSRLIPTDSLQYLQDGSPEIIPTMLAVIGGTANPQTTLFKLVAEIRDKVISRDVQQQPAMYGKLRVGTHLEPHLIDALRSLVKTKWTINEKKSQVWYGQDGLFLVMPTAMNDLVKWIESRGPGMPRDPHTALECLVAARFFAPQSSLDPAWQIKPPESKALTALKVTRPEALLGELELSPLKIKLLHIESDDDEEDDAPENPSTESPDRREDESSLTPSGSGGGESVGKSDTEGSVDDARPSIEREEIASETPRDSTVLNPEPVEVSVNPMAERMLIQLQDGVAVEFIKALLDDHSNSESDCEFVEQGFAIPVSVMMRFGIDQGKVVGRFAATGWLAVNHAKPNAKLMDVEMNGARVKAAVLKREIAQGLGFQNG